MPKPPNKLKTLRITISTTEAVGAYLDQLVATGLFGKTRPEAAERLIARELEAQLEKGTLNRAPTTK